MYNDSNFNQNNPYQNSPNYNPYQDKRSAGMAMASMILGIISITTSGCIYTALICGAVGITLALLSRGGERTMSPTAKIGLALSIIGLILTVVIYVAAVVYLLNQYGSFDAFMQDYFKVYGTDGYESFYQSL